MNSVDYTTDNKLLEALASALPSGKKTTRLTREGLRALLKKAYEIGRDSGYAQGIIEGTEMGSEGW